MKREFIFLLTSLMLIGLLGTASMSLGVGDTWTQKADMPTARCNAGVAVVDGKIYVIGGASGTTIAAVEEYDPTTDTWTKKTDMPTTTRWGLSASVVNGIIYAIGGWHEQRHFLSTVEAYDPVADKWTRKANMPFGGREPYTATVDGKIYAIGGLKSGPTVISTVEVYDPATDTWTKKASMPTVRRLAAACVADGRIYVSGGATEWAPVVFPCVSTVEVYDPATDTWTQASDMPRARFAHSASVVAGKMYIIGGADPEVHQPGDGFSTVDVYDPATDTWTTAADFPNPRVSHTASVVDGKIYVIGGWLGPETPTFSTVYEYDPGLPGVISSVSPAGKLLETWGQIKKAQ